MTRTCPQLVTRVSFSSLFPHKSWEDKRSQQWKMVPPIVPDGQQEHRHGSSYCLAAKAENFPGVTANRLSRWWPSYVGLHTHTVDSTARSISFAEKAWRKALATLSPDQAVLTGCLLCKCMDVFRCFPLGISFVFQAATFHFLEWVKCLSDAKK